MSHLCLGHTGRRLTPAESVQWCRSEQREALRHLGPHVCSDPRCLSQGDVVRWLEDVFAEELAAQQEEA